MSGDPAQRFAAIVGSSHALTKADQMAAYISDTRGRYQGSARMVLRPGSVEEVSAILHLASETGTPIIPQGGNTGLVAGGLPLREGEGREIIVSLSRMNRILEVDTDTNTMTVEAGAVLQTIQQAADEANRLYPLSLGAQGSCQIGGTISTNAGGTGVLAYGNTRDLVMGLEAVLPSGAVWNGLSRLRKDNTGYDLKHLFIGGEGTLGIVTKAVLKLFPKPRGRDVAMVGLSSPRAALDLFNAARSMAGNALTAFELMVDTAMEFTLLHAQNKPRRPLAAQHPWYVLLEVSSGRLADDARLLIEDILSSALERGLIADATIAESGQQRANFWALREDMSWAQKPEGASIKHDISVPVGAIPDFIEEADAAVLAITPGARIVNFGHMGDGNLHYNISQPIGWTAQQHFDREPDINEAVYALIAKYGGSISAEHGIGQMKRDRLAASKDATALAMMRQIKTALDPGNIMNPGKVIWPEEPANRA
ncbi:MAG: FAD-binding oxidoreductase [Ahrensia sp.]|nr:FAD-binding oxidoreductase [Ahrensia sp.]